jgi:3-oxoisoapionate decarboxylase
VTEVTQRPGGPRKGDGVQRRTTMGLTPDSFQSIRFATPQRILSADRLMEIAEQVGAAGAHGGVTDLTLDWAHRTRRMKEDLGMYLEIQTFLPRPDPVEFEQFVKIAKEAGATSLRVVCLLGRRYELMNTLEDWKQAVIGFHKQIEDALPIVERYKMPLGIENHKDWRVDEQVALLERYSSEYLGVSLDTGNNLSILDDPMETVDKLAPWTFNVHFKDMQMEECESGFLLSEVPLGEGMLDLPKMVATIRRAKPDVNFSLEMIVRDPLVVPCLTDKYWSTFPDVNGHDLARYLSWIRSRDTRTKLPRITGLSPQQRLALEHECVDRSIRYASEQLGLV